MEFDLYRRSFIGRWAILTAAILALYAVYNLTCWMFAQDFLHTYTLTGNPPNVYVTASILCLSIGYLSTVLRRRPSKIAVVMALLVIIEGVVDLVEAYLGIDSVLIMRLLSHTTGVAQTISHTLTPMEAIGLISCAILLLDLNYVRKVHYYITALVGALVAMVTFFGIYTTFLDIPQSVFFFKVSSHAPIMIGVIGLCIMSALTGDAIVKPKAREQGVAISFGVGGVLAIGFMSAVLSNNSDERIITFGEVSARAYVAAQTAQVEMKLQFIANSILQFELVEGEEAYDTLFTNVPNALAFAVTHHGEKPYIKIVTRDRQPLDRQIVERFWQPLGTPTKMAADLMSYWGEFPPDTHMRLMSLSIEEGKTHGYVLTRSDDPFASLITRVTPEAFEAVIKREDGFVLYKSANADAAMAAYPKFVIHTGIRLGDLYFPVALVPEIVAIKSFQDESITAVLFFMILTWVLTVYAAYQWFVNRRMARELSIESRQLQRDNAALEERRDQIEQFATVAAHDMKSPLNAIVSIQEWLREDLEPHLNDETRGMFDDIEARVTHLRDMAGSLLAYYRSDKATVTLETIDVEKVVARIAASQPPELRHNIVCDGLPTLHTAVAPLEQILANLIGNALKYHDRDIRNITVAASRYGRFWRFSVEDDGPGIPQAMRRKVFDPFTSALPKNKRKGTGLGLSIVRRLVMGLGGDAGITTGQNGRGTCVYFDWPDQWPD